jgi:hypothetical protein
MIVAILAAAGLMAGAAPAATPTQPEEGKGEAAPHAVSDVQVRAKDKDSDPDRVVCRSVQEVGTRFPRKVCETARETADRRLHDRMDLERNQGTASLPH